MTPAGLDEAFTTLWYVGSMTQSDSRYLFVYGTLMSGAHTKLGTPERLRLAAESDSLGPASLHFARLYDLGRYPGAVHSDGEEEIVHGEAVLLADPPASLAWLDEYEGFVHGGGDANEYDRVVREVRLAGGETFAAWVYLLRRAPDEKKRLVSGRWIGR